MVSINSIMTMESLQKETQPSQEQNYNKKDKSTHHQDTSVIIHPIEEDRSHYSINSTITEEQA